MWLANFEDGSSINSKSCFWTQLKDQSNGKKLTGVQLSHPLFPNLHLALTDLDRYYFVTEAIQFFPGSGPTAPTVVAEMIGGHNLELGVGVEMRLDYKGSVKSKIYKLEKFKHTQDILVEGIRG